MKKFAPLIFTLVVLFSGKSYAQQFQWASAVHDSLKNITAVDIVSGMNGLSYSIYNVDTAGNSFMKLVKSDESGAVVWEKNWIGSSSFVNIEMDSSKQYLYMTGRYYQPMNFDPNGGGSLWSYIDNIFILKMDTAGNFLWSKSFAPLSVNATSSPYDLEITNSGKIYITGSFTGDIEFNPGFGTPMLSGNPAYFNAFIAVLDDAGSATLATRMEGLLFSGSLKIESNSLNEISVAGELYDSLIIYSNPNTEYITSLNHSYSHFIFKLDSAGVFIWKSDLAFDDYSRLSDIYVNSGNDLFVTGIFAGLTDLDPGPGIDSAFASSGQNMFLYQVDQSNNYVRGKTFHSANYSTGPIKIETDINNNVIILGATYNPLFAGGHQNLSAIVANDNLPFSSEVYFLLKLSPCWDYEWHNEWANSPPNGYNNWVNFALQNEKNSVILGNYTGTVDVDPDVNFTYNLISGNEQNGIIVQLKDNSYCIPHPAEGTASPSEVFIESVLLDSISNLNSGTAGGSDYTFYGSTASYTTTLLKGLNYNLTLQNGNSTNSTLACWIDLNGDADFDDAGEKIAEDTITVPFGYKSFSVIVPTTTANGEYRMRIRNVCCISSPDACCYYQNGETEDYSIRLADDSLDAELVQVVDPLNSYCPNNALVTLGAFNRGIQDITSATIKWEVDGLPQTDYNWNGLMPSNTFAAIQLGFFNFIPGTHNFKFWITSPNGLTDYNPSNDTISQTITSVNLPTPVISVANCQLSCNPNTYPDYQWYKNGFFILGSPNGPLFSPFVDGTYSVVCVTNSGCTIASNSIAISFPSAVITPASSVICLGQSDTLSVLTAQDYLWDTGETTQSIVISPQTTTTYYVTVTNADGCSDTSSIGINVNSLPSAGISETDNSGTTSNDNSICEGSSATLTGTGGNTYSWSPVIGIGAGPHTVNPASSSAYTVTVTDGNGCSATTDITINVNPLPSAGIAETDSSGTLSDNIICEGNSATLEGTGGTGYSWNPNIGIGAGPHTVSPLITTTYTVTVSDGNGCTSTSGLTLTVIPSLTAGITETDNSGTGVNDGIICAGDSVSLSGTGGTSFTWSPLIGIGAGPHTVSPATTTSYTVTVLNGNGCTSSSEITITVNNLPAAGITEADNSGNTPNDKIICNGSSATLTGTGGTVYSWSPNLGIGAGPFTISPVSNTSYSVTVTDGNACSSTTSIAISVKAVPTAGITETDNSGISSNDKIICKGEPANLSATGGVLYSWNPNIGNGSGPHIVTPASNTSYTVTVTNGNGCTASSGLTLVVNPVPIPVIAGATSLCNGDSSLLDAGSGYTSYLWTGGQTTQSIYASVSGNYSVVVSDANSCTGSKSVAVFSGNSPLSFAVNGGGSYCLNGSGIPVGLAGSVNGVNYQLHLNGSPLGGPIGGIGTAITFGNQLDSGIYTVSATNTAGCTATMSGSAAITILPLPVVDAGGPYGPLCENDSAILLNGSPANGNYSGTGVSGNNFDPALALSGNFFITYFFTDSNGCSNTDSTEIQVNPSPADPVITVSLTHDTLFSNASQVTWQWFYNGLAVPGATDSILINPQLVGSYFVTVTSGNGCTVNSAVVLNVSAPEIIHNGHIRFFPNPFNVEVTIAGPEGIINELIIQVFDAAGRILQPERKTSNPREITLDMKYFSAGIYFVSIQEENIKHYYKMVKVE